MQIAYCDSGLKGNLGHHAQSARVLVPALESAGHEVAVHVVNGVDESVVGEFDARQTFRHYCYVNYNLEPIAGWLQDFMVVGSQTADDLVAIAPDRLYWNSAQPKQLHAVLIYLHQNPAAHAVLEFGTSCGLETKINDKGMLEGNYPAAHVNATATMYRYCSFLIDDSIRSRLTLCTFDERASALYSNVLDCPVQTFPLPRNAVDNPRLRGADKKPLTISFLGHQRHGDKGYQLVPMIVRDVMERSRFLDRPIRFLIHNADPEGNNGVKEIQQQVRQLHVEYPDKVGIDERVADKEIWQGLLDVSDLIVCPYWPERFHASYSAACAEAIANGIPMVVPDGTSLASMIDGFGSGFAFDRWTSNGVANAILKAVKTFDAMAPEAFDGVAKWKAKHGADKTAAAIVESLE